MTMGVRMHRVLPRRPRDGRWSSPKSAVSSCLFRSTFLGIVEMQGMPDPLCAGPEIVSRLAAPAVAKCCMQMAVVGVGGLM